MHKIETEIRKERYEGLKGKLIHLEPKTFKMLNTISKLKNITLKKYIETLCIKQAIFEAESYINSSN